MKRAFLSFFSGALGLDLGLKRAGLTPLAVNEIDPKTCETIRRNTPDTPLYPCDICTLDPHELMRDHHLRPGELFLVCGGPPCQSFSTAGKRAGLADPRGNAFLYFIEMIGALLPRYAVIENVRGLLSAPLVHRPHALRGPEFPPLSAEEQPGGALERLIEGLREWGYEIDFELYNTANFGVPQARERIVLFASRSGKSIPSLLPTHNPGGTEGRDRWRTLRDAIADLPSPDPADCARFPEKRLRFYRMLTEGQNWRNLPPELHAEALGGAHTAKGGRMGFYRRLAWDRPSPTLVTCPTMPATDLAHPEANRPLSVAEYARIQTFPDTWEFAGNLADRYRQIGNAVPVEFGRVIGEHLLACDAGHFTSPASISPRSRYRNTDSLSWEANRASPFLTEKGR